MIIDIKTNSVILIGIACNLYFIRIHALWHDET